MNSKDNTALEDPVSGPVKGRGISLLKFIPIVFVSMMILLAVLLLSILQSTAQESAESLAHSFMNRVSQRVLENTNRFLDSAAQVARTNAGAFELNGMQPDPENALFLDNFYKLTNNQMGQFPHLGLIYLGDENGNHWLNKKEHDGTVHARTIRRLNDSPESRQSLKQAGALMAQGMEHRDAAARLLTPHMLTQWHERGPDGRLAVVEQDPVKVYDPRQRPWYSGAVAKKALFWTDIYIWEDKWKGQVNSQIGITASIPVHRDGKLLGVAGVDIILKEVSDFLHAMKIMQHGRAFIFNTKGQVVSLPRYEEMFATNETDGKRTLKRMQDLSDRVIGGAYQQYRQQVGEQTLQGSEQKLIRFTTDEQGFFTTFVPFPSAYGLDWVVGVVVPEDDFLGDTKSKMELGRLLLVPIILLMVALAILIIRGITRPLKQLGDDIDRITNFNLASQPPLKTRFSELSAFTQGFVKMKQGMVFIINKLADHAISLEESADAFSNVAAVMDDHVNRLNSQVGDLFSSLELMEAHLKAVDKATHTLQVQTEEMQRISDEENKDSVLASPLQYHQREMMEEVGKILGQMAQLKRDQETIVENLREVQLSSFEIQEMGEPVMERSSKIKTISKELYNILKKFTV